MQMNTLQTVSLHDLKFDPSNVPAGLGQGKTVTTGTINANGKVGKGSVQVKRLDTTRYLLVSWPCRQKMAKNLADAEETRVQGHVILTLAVNF